MNNRKESSLFTRTVDFIGDLIIYSFFGLIFIFLAAFNMICAEIEKFLNPPQMKALEFEKKENYEEACILYSKAEGYEGKVRQLWEAHGPFYFEKFYYNEIINTDNDDSRYCVEREFSMDIQIILNIVAHKRNPRKGITPTTISPSGGSLAIRAYIVGEMSKRHISA
jgi:hypothetical protein